MTAESVYLDGRIVGRADALVSAFDRGLLYGDGFFETTRVHRGRAVLLERHVARMLGSCKRTGFGAGPDGDRLCEGARRLIEVNRVTTGYLRVTVTRGPHGGALTELECRRPTVLIEARSMELAPVAEPPPWRLARAAFRVSENSPIAGHKSLSYQANLLSLAESRAAGADETYFLNSRGHLCEGAISNLFFVSESVVRTPALECGLLPGITRAVVLELCDRHGIPVETGLYGESALLSAREVFCTNSLRGIIPVTAALGAREATFGPGPLTRALQAHYAAMLEGA